MYKKAKVGQSFNDTKNVGFITVLVSLGVVINVETNIADTRQGLPDGFSIEDETFLGMTLINSLSNQLGAEINVQSISKGTSIKVIFA